MKYSISGSRRIGYSEISLGMSYLPSILPFAIPVVESAFGGLRVRKPLSL